MNYFPNEVCIGLQEIPNEISLIVPLAGCANSLNPCIGCHSKEQQSMFSGENLSKQTFLKLLNKNINKISCVCFFNGEFRNETEDLIKLVKNVKLKVALYSGANDFCFIKKGILNELDYIKIGEYKEELGGLDSQTTNQRLYEKINNEWIDITKQFWRNND